MIDLARMRWLYPIMSCVEQPGERCRTRRICELPAVVTELEQLPGTGESGDSSQEAVVT